MLTVVRKLLEISQPICYQQLAAVKEKKSLPTNLLYFSKPCYLRQTLTKMFRPYPTFLFSMSTNASGLFGQSFSRLSDLSCSSRAALFLCIFTFQKCAIVLHGGKSGDLEIFVMLALTRGIKNKTKLLLLPIVCIENMKIQG